MRRSEIYDDLMDHVCEICEVRRELVVGDRKLQAVFDALDPTGPDLRWMSIYIHRM